MGPEVRFEDSELASPPIFDVLAVLGKDESLARLRDQLG